MTSTAEVWSQIRQLVISSRAARVVALPVRLAIVGRHLLGETLTALRWLAASREHTNFTYDLQPNSVEHLCWFVGNLTGLPVEQIRGYLRELQADDALAEHIITATNGSNRRWLADDKVRFGRRLGWYALIRATRPALVVETGTDKGLGTCVIAAAILRNGRGKVVTIDVNPKSGYLIGPPYSDVIVRWVGDSVALLPNLGCVDVFIHDSLHTRDHELAELSALDLTPNSWVLSDNSHVTNALATWAEHTGRRFQFYDERPAAHWHPGAGIGVAWHPDSDLTGSSSAAPNA